MAEFRLIDAIVAVFDQLEAAPAVVLGPGDDAAILRVPAGTEVVASIDTLVAERHFPATALPQQIGYRALMVAASDLAAMAAEPGYATVALTLDTPDREWVCDLAAGIAEAAEVIGLPVVGGNLARGPLALTISVQGYVPVGTALRRDGGRPGDRVLVSGPLGGSAAAVRTGAVAATGASLSPVQRAYFRPLARLDLRTLLRGQASAGLDLSDGLLQDLDHLCRASAVGAEVRRSALPLTAGAQLEDALGASDDYELCFTVPAAVPDAPFLAAGCTVIGELTAALGIRLDGEPVAPETGYDHFVATGAAS